MTNQISINKIVKPLVEKLVENTDQLNLGILTTAVYSCWRNDD